MLTIDGGSHPPQGESKDLNQLVSLRAVRLEHYASHLYLTWQTTLSLITITFLYVVGNIVVNPIPKETGSNFLVC